MLRICGFDASVLQARSIYAGKSNEYVKYDKISLLSEHGQNHYFEEVSIL